MSPGDPAERGIRFQVAVQANYVHGTLPRRPGICEVCYGAVAPDRSRCHQCVRASRASGGVLADVVVPISYRVKDSGQHARDLVMYKRPWSGRQAAQRRLFSLFWYFCRRHIECVKDHLGIDHFTHAAFVPSTKNPGMVHPLQQLIAPRMPLPVIELKVGRQVAPESREFDPDWFSGALAATPTGRPAQVLLVDDTWVTGARAQSAAHALKRAGAERVAVLVLARELSPTYEHSRPLLDTLSRTRFDPERCVLHRPARG